VPDLVKVVLLNVLVLEEGLYKLLKAGSILSRGDSVLLEAEADRHRKIPSSDPCKRGEYQKATKNRCET